MSSIGSTSYHQRSASASKKTRNLRQIELLEYGYGFADRDVSRNDKNRLLEVAAMASRQLKSVQSKELQQSSKIGLKNSTQGNWLNRERTSILKENEGYNLSSCKQLKSTQSKQLDSRNANVMMKSITNQKESEHGDNSEYIRNLYRKYLGKQNSGGMSGGQQCSESGKRGQKQKECFVQKEVCRNIALEYDKNRDRSEKREKGKCQRQKREKQTKIIGKENQQPISASRKPMFIKKSSILADPQEIFPEQINLGSPKRSNYQRNSCNPRGMELQIYEKETRGEQDFYCLLLNAEGSGSDILRIIGDQKNSMARAMGNLRDAKRQL